MFFKLAIYTCLLFFNAGMSSAYEYSVPGAVSGRIHNDIQPRDVYARAVWLNEEITLLDVDNKLTIKNTVPAYKVTNAQPYEVNFIAKSVLNKAQRLSFSYTKKLGGHTPKSKLFHDQPINVFRLLNQSMISIQFVKQANEIETLCKEEIVTNATPSDVYNMLLENARMLSNLNTNKIKPSDVLEVIDEAFDLAIEIKQNSLKGGTYINTEIINKAQYTDKTPRDVFYNLVSLYGLLTEYARDEFTKEILQIEIVEIDREIEPSDVIDLANLILAELTYLTQSNSLMTQKKPVQLNNRTGKTTPSTVFNRVNDIRAVLTYSK